MAYLEINLSKLIENYRNINQQLDPGVRFCAVVKNNAYGMGLKEIGRTLSNQGVGWFAVNTLDEALSLRQEGVLQPILILGMVDPERDIPQIIRNNFSVILYDLPWAREAAKAAQKLGKKLSCHLKIDTGMHRFGIYPHEVLDFLDNIKHLSSIEIEGVFSHLASATDLRVSQEQQNSFNEALFKLQSIGYQGFIAHLLSTNGIKTLPDAHFDMVRVGAGLYGFAQNLENLTPIWALKTKIISIKRVPQNVPIGYGNKFVSTRSMLVAVAELGYSDGIQRAISNKLKAELKDKIINQIGMLCMSYCMFDITGLNDIKIGDILTVISPDNKIINAQNLAKQLDTTVYELSSCLPKDLKRVYSSIG